VRPGRALRDCRLGLDGCEVQVPAREPPAPEEGAALQRHDGAPKLEEAPDPCLPGWYVNLIMDSKNKFLGSVMAKDLEDAKEKAIVFFKLSPEQSKRVLIIPQR
jgi:hypothetical protein